MVKYQPDLSKESNLEEDILIKEENPFYLSANEEYNQEYSNVTSPKNKEPNQFNSMCLNSLTIGGFIKDNSIENEKLNISFGQNGGNEEEKTILKKKCSIDDRRESVNTSQKVKWLFFKNKINSEELYSQRPERMDSILDSNTMEIYQKIRQKCHNTNSELNTINHDKHNSQYYDSYFHFVHKVDDVGKDCSYPDIRHQNTQELIDFISCMEPDLCEIVQETFTEHQIDGKVFLKLKEHDLDDLGINKISDRIILRDIVNKFKRMMKTKRKLKKQQELEAKFNAQKNAEDQNEIKNLQTLSSHSSANIIIKKDRSAINNRKNSSEKLRKMSSKLSHEMNSLDLINSFRQNQEQNKVNSGVSIDSEKGFDFSDSKKTIEQHKSMGSASCLMKNSLRKYSYRNFCSLDSLDDSDPQNFANESFDNVSMICHCQNSERSLKFRASSSSSSSQDSNEDSDACVYYVHDKTHRSMRFKFDSNIAMRKFEIKKDDLDIRTRFELIGAGEYGKVYKTRLYSSTDVAVKIFDNNKIKNQTIINIMEEAELLLSLRFPNIILCMGWCMHSNLLMLVFEYMTQGSLFKVLHLDKIKLNLIVKLHILRKIANGMTHLHSREILHCDLKSSNILLADDFQTVKVCDLGMSFLKNKLRKKNNKWNSLSHYSAPEILRGEKFENPADVYSYGMIIWEMMTGSKPYQDISKPHLVGIVGYDCNHKLQLDSSQYESKSLYELMLKTLDRDPKKRPTFKEISKKLDRIVEHTSKRLRQRKNLGILLSCGESQSD